MAQITQSELHEILDYDPETGIFRWKHNLTSHIRKGAIAGSSSGFQYCRIFINKKRYLAHYLAWLYVYGAFPSGTLSHRDGDDKNNAIMNLEPAKPRRKNVLPPTMDSCGMTRHPMRPTWHSMMQRCYLPDHQQYKHYGARGILVHERWHNLKNFIEDFGPKPGPKMQMDRIDNDGNYAPGNVRWVTPKENSRNKRNSTYVEHNGKKMHLLDVAEEMGISEYKLKKQLANRSKHEHD